MKVAVVTPTIASKHLKQCIDSVNKQTYKDITHYIFVDGCQYEPEARKILKQSPKTKMIELEENVGKGWYGHRVYAACSFLVNADVICYLDEDNWYEPNQIINDHDCQNGSFMDPCPQQTRSVEAYRSRVLAFTIRARSRPTYPASR